MNDMLFRTLLKRYEANIEDALYKIQSFNENNIIIPEHIDITGEVDKLLQIIQDHKNLSLNHAGLCFFLYAGVPSFNLIALCLALYLSRLSISL